MRRSPEAEKPVRVAIGIQAKRFDFADTGSEQAMNDIAFKVEMRLAFFAHHEEALIIGIVVKKARPKSLVDLVGTLRNARADGDMDVFPSCASSDHCLDRGVGDAGKRAAPARVRGTDDDRAMVREEDRSAIRGKDPKQEIGRVGHHRIRPWTLVEGPCTVGNDHLRGMNLVDSCKLGLGEDRGYRQAPVAGDRLAIIKASITDIQTRHIAHRHPAATSEERVRQLPEANRPDGFDPAQRDFRKMMSSSA